MKKKKVLLKARNSHVIRGEEHNDVSVLFGAVDLQHQPQGGVEVVLAAAAAVHRLGRDHGVHPDERDAAAVVAQQLAGHGWSAEDHHPELGPLQQDVPEEAQQHVCADCPLVGLVDDDYPVVLQERVRHHLPEQHVISAVPDREHRGS